MSFRTVVFAVCVYSGDKFTIGVTESRTVLKRFIACESTTYAGKMIDGGIHAGSGGYKVSFCRNLTGKVVAEFFNNDIGEFNFRLFFVKVYRTTFAFVVSHQTVVQAIGVNLSNNRTKIVTESVADLKQKLSSQSRVFFGRHFATSAGTIILSGRRAGRCGCKISVFYNLTVKVVTEFINNNVDYFGFEFIVILIAGRTVTISYVTVVNAVGFFAFGPGFETVSKLFAVTESFGADLVATSANLFINSGRGTCCDRNQVVSVGYFRIIVTESGNNLIGCVLDFFTVQRAVLAANGAGEVCDATVFFAVGSNGCMITGFRHDVSAVIARRKGIFREVSANAALEVYSL